MRQAATVLTSPVLEFQFTHPVWGATVDDLACDLTPDVSIHAPRVGCDADAVNATHLRYGFNSRTPCGVRRGSLGETLSRIEFQFTHPVWGATFGLLSRIGKRQRFNSRTPCGVRLCAEEYDAPELGFQFTHPVWGATPDKVEMLAWYKFQFTHPVWGATIEPQASSCGTISFNSRTPCGVRPISNSHITFVSMFQFTHPVWGATARSPRPYPPRDVSIHAPRVGCDF